MKIEHSECSIRYFFMDSCGYDFVIIVKGMRTFVNQIALDCKGTFEDMWE
ncbi:hypothetical protein LQZ18_01870 [Lachnospiraceae bacterium ZAX-1]